MNIHCPRCGFPNPAGSLFCSQCTSRLQIAYAAPDPALVHAQPSRAVAVLVLGILSLAVCAVLGPIAWVMGNIERDRIASGQVAPHDAGMANAGRICGIVGTIVLALSVVWIAVLGLS